jgi:hypothetical protein
VLLAVAGCRADGSDDYLQGCAHETVSATDGLCGGSRQGSQVGAPGSNIRSANDVLLSAVQW